MYFYESIESLNVENTDLIKGSQLLIGQINLIRNQFRYIYIFLRFQ